MTNVSNAKPFVKWVGGKRSILGELLPRIPNKFDRYFEPFVGGGALFWNMPQKENSYLSDINFHLIITYSIIRDNVRAVISKLEEYKSSHCKEQYDRAKIKLSETEDPIEIAALFIYLNKTCYNGLYRVNKSGNFNTPIGKYTTPNILEADNLMRASDNLKGTSIFQHEFFQLTPRKNDFVYLDPPYHNAFSSYDSAGFIDKDHERLAKFCRELDRSGILFMASNSDTPFVRKLYDGFRIEIVKATRSVACKANRRGKENELIIRNY
ncbi:MAG: DNA adenine methylase [Puniceicoccales bacterium]|jgi:DNA adenine methylase|nr:DNA adenine methylase [Puniceicoccales bacterium]